MLTVGERLPEFKMKATVSTELEKAFADITHQSYPGKWLVLFFYPLDFTFVCPTEILAFSDRVGEFKEAGAEVVGVGAVIEKSFEGGRAQLEAMGLRVRSLAVIEKMTDDEIIFAEGVSP